MRPALINHKVSGDRDVRVELHHHPAVPATGNIQHVLSDLTSVRPGEIDTRGFCYAHLRDVGPEGKRDKMKPSERQVSY